MNNSDVKKFCNVGHGGMHCPCCRADKKENSKKIRNLRKQATEKELREKTNPVLFYLYL